jgi:hypothetical protein
MSLRTESSTTSILTFVAEEPPSSRIFIEVALMAAEERAEYF